ncbi:MAG TPA: PH domain-containing protein [Candidatus Limnocylindrales bacterium]|nr:PH domain-containing protein [Candidatus Limnocylindrales bacterium]
MSKLLPGENPIIKDHPHWITIVGSLILPVVLVVAVALADFTIFSPNNVNSIYVPHLRTFLSLGVAALALLWLIVVWIGWRSVTYTLTDQRITIESGVFSRQEKIIPIDRVQDCTTRVSLIGRVLGYGRVEVDAAGAQGAEVLQYLPKPGEFRDQVFVQSEKRRGGGAPAPSTAPMPANPSGV